MSPQTLRTNLANLANLANLVKSHEFMGLDKKTQDLP